MKFREYFTHHARWGKLMGAVLGFLMAGPIGALFGILIGNFFDRGLASHYTKPHRAYRDESSADVRDLFINATYATMGHIAKADGRVSEESIRVTQALMFEMGLNPKKRRLAQQAFHRGKQENFRITTLLNPLQSVCLHNPELLKLFVDIQYRIAQVDGLSLKKTTLLNLIFNHLGLAPLHHQARFNQDFFYQNAYQQRTQQRDQQSHHARPNQASGYGSLNTSYAILGVTPTASKEHVKRAYRRLMSQHHPDKMIAQGASEKMIKMANEKTQSIRKAYEQICECKGW
jgi:DnaJ like chaperone protein